MPTQIDNTNKSQMIKFFWFLIVFFNLLMVGFACSFLLSLHTFVSLKSNGIVAQAKVTASEWSQKNRGMKIYTLHYEFRDDKEGMRKGQETVTLVSAKVGDKIEVEYLNSDPDVSRIVGNYTLALNAICLFGLTICLIFANRYALKIKSNPDLLFKK